MTQTAFGLCGLAVILLGAGVLALKMRREEKKKKKAEEEERARIYESARKILPREFFQ